MFLNEYVFVKIQQLKVTGYLVLYSYVYAECLHTAIPRQVICPVTNRYNYRQRRSEYLPCICNESSAAGSAIEDQ